MHYPIALEPVSSAELEGGIILIMDNGKDFNREVLMKNILNQKWPHPHNVFYVGLFKESETGLMFNDRMLVVEDRTFAIFYTKCFKPLPLLL